VTTKKTRKQEDININVITVQLVAFFIITYICNRCNGNKTYLVL